METDYKLNVTAYEDVSRHRDPLQGPLYDASTDDCDMKEWSEGRIISPGFFTSLEDIALAFRDFILDTTEDTFERGNLSVNYESDPRQDSFGPLGYTSPDGSYLQRPLNGEELRELVAQMDEKLRPVLYKESKE